MVHHRQKVSIRIRILAVAIGLTVLITRAIAGQTVAERIAIGDSLYAELKPGEALQHYMEAIPEEPENHALLWRIARSQIDSAKQLEDLEGKEHGVTRDSLYELAASYAIFAIRADSSGAEGYFMLSQALGRLSRTKGGRDRVRYGKEIYDAAARALELDPDHDGAHHVIGAWHAEVRRLSGVARFFARTFMGGGYMGIANWDSAVAHLERAVELRSEHIYHRLELARIYFDRERYAEATQQLERIPALPVGDVLDPKYKEEAAELLEELRDRG